MDAGAVCLLALIADLCSEFNVADLERLSILYVRLLWAMLLQKGSVFTKESVCTLIIWHVRRNFRIKLFECLPFKVGTENVTFL